MDPGIREGAKFQPFHLLSRTTIELRADSDCVDGISTRCYEKLGQGVSWIDTSYTLMRIRTNW